MKTLIEVQNDGLVGFLGKNVTLFCDSYIYHGNLCGISDTCAKLDNAKIVYLTGAFSDNKFEDAQPLFNEGSWYVQLNKIESFGILNKD